MDEKNNEFSNYAENTKKDVEEFAADKAHDLKQTANNVSEFATDKAHDLKQASDRIGEYASDQAQDFRQNAFNARNDIEEYAQDVADRVEQAYETSKDKTAHGIRHTTRNMVNKTRRGFDKLEEFAEDATEGLKRVSQKIKQTVETTKDKISHITKRNKDDE